MSDRLFFNGVDAYGQLDSAIDFADGDYMEFNIRSQGITADDEIWLVSSSDSADGILLKKSNAGGDDTFQIKQSGSFYNTGYSTTSTLLDGEEHVLKITRNVNTYEFDIDGTQVTTKLTSSADFDIEFIGKDGTSGTKFFPFEIWDFKIGSSTYPTNEASGTTVADDSGNANDITITDVDWVFLGTWEWVGDFVHIDKTWSAAGGGTNAEERVDGVRRRVTRGYSMTNPLNKQAGDTEAAGVSALNGGVETLLEPITATLDCDEEVFSPIEGSGITWQRQRWTSWTVS